MAGWQYYYINRYYRQRWAGSLSRSIETHSLNKIVLVQISFQKQGVPACTIPQAAYFTAILASPTAPATPSSTVSPSPTLPVGGTPTGTPTGSPSPTPKPTKTPKPH